MAMISIIIRSRNDIRFIGETIKMIRKQRIRSVELIHVDSGSTDGTREVIERYQPELFYQTPAESYRPGRVLNDAIKKSRGEIVVFNNSDCIPRDQFWLERLIEPLNDPGVIATFGNQIPRKDATPLVKKDYQRAFGDGSISKKWRHFFSLATSAVRRADMVAYPFNDELQYSEDIEWSYRMKQMGYKIVYVPDAVVEHSHNYTLKELYRRFHGEGVAEGFIYGEEHSFFNDLVKPGVMEVIRDLIYLMQQKAPEEIFRAPLYRLIQRYALYRGKKQFFRGRDG